jgi:outer membrane protein, heavy metal efflux system
MPDTLYAWTRSLWLGMACLFGLGAPGWANSNGMVSANVARMATAQAQTLSEAIEAAWLKRPQSQAADMRRKELEARVMAAQSWTRDAPAITLENWSDRWSRREGFAKYAGEFALPLWLPGERQQTKASIAADRDYFESVISATRLVTAGEVREAFWGTQLALVEFEVAQLRVNETQRLGEDLDRRLKAGVSSRVDAQSARAQVQTAQSALALAQASVFRSAQHFELLTGLRAPAIAQLGERRHAAESLPDSGTLTQHPAVVALEKAALAARTALSLAALTNRDTPELGIGVFRERSTSNFPFENIVTLRLRIPFSTDARNAPRIAQANAQLIEALAQIEQERKRLQSELSIAMHDWAAQKEAVSLARGRQVLALDNHRLIGKAFELGEMDFPTRLRSQAELIDAELMVRRALIEQARAESRIHQALGLLP